MLHELLAKHPLVRSSPAPRIQNRRLRRCAVNCCVLRVLALYSHPAQKACFGTETIILIPGAHTLFEPGEAGVARASPHFNPVVPYYAAGRDPSWYLADGSKDRLQSSFLKLVG